MCSFYRTLYKPDHILRLVFDDITVDEIKERYKLPNNIKDSNEKTIGFIKERGINIFSDRQAKRITEFVFKYKDETNLLICQCHFGQSRSAGCAAAIVEYFSGNGADIFADKRYYPSKLVYLKVLQAFRESEAERSKEFSRAVESNVKIIVEIFDKSRDSNRMDEFLNEIKTE